MKKNLSALLAALMLLSVTACAAHEPVLPPSRWGEMQINSMFERCYSVSDAFREADAVARVKVGDWQGEDLRNWVTFFDASVQESYKGGASPELHPGAGRLFRGDLSRLSPVYQRNRASGFPAGL